MNEKELLTKEEFENCMDLIGRAFQEVVLLIQTQNIKDVGIAHLDSVNDCIARVRKLKPR